MENKKIKVVIGAGGTGGHLFPASEIKKELESRGYDVYLITDNRGKRFASKFEKISVIIGGGLSGENLWYRIRSLTKLAIGFIQTFFYMITIRPQVVIGMGGYISVPVVLWGKILGKKTIIHNADSILGNANIFLSRFADVVAVSFKNTKKIPQNANVKFVGLPLREDIKEIANTDYPVINDKVPFVIAVMGGSQGAQIFSDTVSRAVAMLDEKIRQRLFIYQQVVKEDIDEVKSFYKSFNIKCDVRSFFENPANILEKCHLFIGRAGASTVLEIGTIGRPSIFIPVKHKDRQQVINAEQITTQGGGEIILQDDFTAESLYNVLKKLVINEKLLENMAKKAKIFKLQNNASKNIVDEIDKLLLIK